MKYDERQQAVVETHGKCVAATSSMGVGSVFILPIPLAVNDGDPREPMRIPTKM